MRFPTSWCCTFSGANWLLVSASGWSAFPIGQRSLRQGADILKHVCISMYIYVYYICVYICLYTYIYICMYIQIYVCWDMRISPYDFEAVKLFSGIVFDADRKSYLTLLFVCAFDYVIILVMDKIRLHSLWPVGMVKLCGNLCEMLPIS